MTQMVSTESSARESVLLCSNRDDWIAKVNEASQKLDLNVTFASGIEDTVAQLRAKPVQVCMIDLAADVPAVESQNELTSDIHRLPRFDISQLPAAAPCTSFVMIGTEDESRQFAVFSESDAVSVELWEHSANPIQVESAINRSKHYARLLAQKNRLEQELTNQALRELLGESKPMRWLAELIRQASADKQEKNVLLLGESGTGKHLAARAICRGGNRAGRPYTELNCGVLSSEQFQTAFFGGGARLDVDYQGPSVRISDNGTVFLAEIDQAPVPVQKRLARFLEQQQRKAARFDDSMARQVRVIASSSIDIKARVRDGKFSKELYNCLAETIIMTPPLRECREDIPLLANTYLERLAIQEGRPSMRLSPEALRLLSGHDWPGNVRELHRSLNQASKLQAGNELTEESVKAWLAGNVESENNVAPEMTLREMERKLIEATFARFNGNRERTAQALNIGIRTLSGKLREYGYPPRGGPGSNLRAA